MVRGLEHFREHFSQFGDRYVLIGGTACDLTMTDAGLTFRATSDLDIVLCIEALDHEFAEAFWSYVNAGGYEQKEQSTGEMQFYRFQKPTDETYPEMLELFSRVPDLLVIAGDSHLTPIPIDEDVSSLSAILLNDDYYQWIHDGKIEIEGVPIVRAEHLIPLKARAWIDLHQREANGERVDSREIKKHKNDVFKLVQIIDPDYDVVLPTSISNDMQQFIDSVVGEPPVLKQLGIKNTSFKSMVDTMKEMYQLE